MPQSKAVKYTMFASLYFTQGTILSYFTSLNALYFLSRGRSMTDVGVFAMIALIPFVIKIFLGMISDKVNLFGMGNRKPYILLGLAVQFICLIVAPFIDLNTGYWGFVVLAFILQMGMALYDTCTDGLALDTTPEKEHGIIQGFMVGGRAVAVIITAVAAGYLADNVSWIAVFWMLAALTLLPLPLVLRLKETPRPASERFNWGAFRAFKQAPVWLVAVAGLIAFLVVVGGNQLVNPSIEKSLAISMQTAGIITAFWGIGVVIGGLLGGRLLDRWGMPAIYLALGITSLSLLAIGWLITPQSTMLLVFVLAGVFGLAYGTYQATYYALSMRYTAPAIAASMFAILMAFSNVGQGIGLGLGGTLVDKVGYPLTFAILAGVNLLALPLFIAVRNKKLNTEAL